MEEEKKEGPQEPLFGNRSSPRAENRVPNWGNQQAEEEEDELSDYVDENFDIDETDELWGLNEQMDKFRNFETKDNDIKKIAGNNCPSD